MPLHAPPNRSKAAWWASVGGEDILRTGIHISDELKEIECIGIVIVNKKGPHVQPAVGLQLSFTKGKSGLNTNPTHNVPALMATNGASLSELRAEKTLPGSGTTVLISRQCRCSLIRS